MTEVALKLAELGYYTFMERPKGTEMPIVSELKGLGLELPDDYAAFLTEFPETGMFDREVAFRGRHPSPWAYASGADGLEALYGWCRSDYEAFDIFHIRDQYLDEFGPSYLAIGEMPGGSRVVMSCAGKDKGRIYAWDHEQDPGVGKGFYLAFDDFSSFIDALFEEEEQESYADDTDERVHYGINLRSWLRGILGKNKT